MWGDGGADINLCVGWWREENDVEVVMGHSEQPSRPLHMFGLVATARWAHGAASDSGIGARTTGKAKLAGGQGLQIEFLDAAGERCVSLCGPMRLYCLVHAPSSV